jgi:hypothetical protein
MPLQSGRCHMEVSKTLVLTPGLTEMLASSSSNHKRSEKLCTCTSSMSAGNETQACFADAPESTGQTCVYRKPLMCHSILNH